MALFLLPHYFFMSRPRYLKYRRNQTQRQMPQERASQDRQGRHILSRHSHLRLEAFLRAVDVAAEDEDYDIINDDSDEMISDAPSTTTIHRHPGVSGNDNKKEGIRDGNSPPSSFTEEEAAVRE